MEEQLIEFKTAELAREKGFDLEVIYSYNKEDKELYQKFRNLYDWNFKDTKHNLISAPTQSLLQKWLREVHNIEFDIIVTKIGENKKSYDIFIIDTSKVEIKQNKKVLYSFFNFKNYEEVLELGLQEALKLIK